MLSLIGSSVSNNFNLVKNTMCSPTKGTVFTVLAFSGIALLTTRWFFSSSTRFLETRGHFDYNEYAKNQDGALNVVKKCFDKMVDRKANNGWDWIYISQKDAIFNTVSLKEVNGTCFGNCCALGKEIIHSGKILSAAELQKIERADKFPKRAMGFQFVQNVCHEICERVDKDYHTSAFERPSELTTEEKKTLGNWAKHFCYHRHVEQLKTYGLSFEDVSKFSKEEFIVLHALIIRSDVPFDWARKEIFQNLDLTTGKDLIEWGVSNGFPEVYRIPNREGVLRPAGNLLGAYPNLIYPKKVNVENKESFYLCNKTLQESDLIKECPEIKQPNFSGFFIISGSQTENGAAGHALLLEIENQTNTYVLYDNNLGFYSGESLEDCLGVLNGIWNIYKYKIRMFYPYIFQNSHS